MTLTRRTALLIPLLASSPVRAQFLGGGSILGANGNSVASQQFLNRLLIQSLSADEGAYADYIDGLVSDNAWNNLDFLHLTVAQNALAWPVNIKSNLFTAFLGSDASQFPTFTARAGIVGVHASGSGVFPDFDPATSQVNYTSTSAMFAVWSTTTGQNDDRLVQCGSFADLTAYGTDGKFSYNVNGATDTAATNTNDGSGLWIGERSGSAISLRRNDVLVSSASNSAVALTDATFKFATGAFTILLMAGGSPFPTNAARTAFYNRSRTVITALSQGALP